MLRTTIFTVILLRAGFACLGQSTDGPAKILPQSSQAGMTSSAGATSLATNTAAGAGSCPTPQTRTSSSEHGACGLGSRPRPRSISSRLSSSIPGMLEHGKACGITYYNGGWLSAEQRIACAREANVQRKADGKWKHLLQQWKTWLAEDANRAKAEQCLAEVSDPRAVPAICSVFAAGRAGTRSWRCNSWDRFRVQRRHAGWRCWPSLVVPPRYAVRQWKRSAGATRSSSPIC